MVKGIISDYNRNFHLFSVNSSHEKTILFFYMTAMLGIFVSALDGKMTIMGIFIDQS